MNSKSGMFTIAFAVAFSLLYIPVGSPIWFTGEDHWTFMVYLDADNNLNDVGLIDMNEMEHADPTKTNVLVLYDGPDSGDTHLTKVKGDDDPYSINSPLLAHEEVWQGYEANMGDPAVLANFIKWSMRNYPADNYALVIWDHGSGITEYQGNESRGIAQDDTDHDFLSHSELIEALKEGVGDERLEIIIFDACLMGMVELAYDLTDIASYMVASQEVVPGDGLPYYKVLKALEEDHHMSPGTLSRKIVKEYDEYYGDAMDTTISAVDISRMDELTLRIDELAQLMISNIDEIKPFIKEARCQVQSYYYPYYVDLYHLCELLSEDENLGSCCSELMVEIGRSMIAERHSDSVWVEGGSVIDSHGLSIYFPASSWEYFEYYDGESGFLGFAVDHQWDEFLRVYLAC